VSVNTGGVLGNCYSQRSAGRAFEATTTIGCGACVAAWRYVGILFVSGVTNGARNDGKRVENMIAQMDAEGTGACSTVAPARRTECPVGISSAALPS
jgi:coenzyme F420-reducing hydrogenase beta subunit